MSPNDYALTVVEAGVWLAFIYFAIDTIRSRRKLWWASLVLLALAYLGFVTCPLVRHSDAWPGRAGYGGGELALGAAEAALWYAFIWFGLDTVRGRRGLWWASLVLLALFYAAFLVCPWVRDTEAWQHLWN